MLKRYPPEGCDTRMLPSRSILRLRDGLDEDQVASHGQYTQHVEAILLSSLNNFVPLES